MSTTITHIEKKKALAPKLRFKGYNENWINFKIDDLVNNKILDKPLDGNHGNIHPVSSDFVTSGIPFIMANNIRNGHLILSGATCIKKEQADKLQKGFSIERSFVDSQGQCWIYSNSSKIGNRIHYVDSSSYILSCA
ncbi:MAG: hypothetical protein A3F72_04275 [Bacteroidetes bacterium RIFCSPLOWO2_12_FULL_35_15]|nr:MAG: hypothetical protein A3F72_04275 [Bacteroidetes bacterium RIFCSPLOWO2_12_FULL_35_15]